ncbi:NAD(+) diphosphatase [Brevundimonas sp. 2R-24]|uniref:NAD(+) diphosphatase n=1 Tax=Peiella sedimenti TaxID=3061083 RepID=A0ABT8SKJ1_9CAUL|nr:NAD(+) diphosphatase [Caulobacteraceae bacterium XZ-24]
MPLDAFVNTFAGGTLDRGGDARNEPAWVEARLADPSALAAVLWEGRAMIAGEALARVPLAMALAAAGDRWAFLGFEGERPLFAVELEGPADPAEGPFAGRGGFTDMRSAAALLPGEEAAVAGLAKSLFDWRRRHGFCSACGQESRNACAGWKRVCPACRTEHFPRVDPVAIMLPVQGERCLLGRQHGWPEGRMSALAGFIEPGESIEEGCARELLEEAGLRARRVIYHSSQPWPFPSSLMIGLIAQVEPGEAAPDEAELEEVQWFTREEARAVVRGEHPQIKAPPPFAIAAQLLKAWAEDGFGD